MGLNAAILSLWWNFLFEQNIPGRLIHNYIIRVVLHAHLIISSMSDVYSVATVKCSDSFPFISPVVAENPWLYSVYTF